jgi:tetratricopeptide (TPR) repeat protein
MGPKDCVLRIQRMAQVINSQIPFKGNPHFNCSVTMEPMAYPTVLDCGHIFETTIAERVMECPHCRMDIETRTPLPLLKSLIDEQQQKERIPTMSHFKKENKKLAESYLQIAKSCEKAEEYEEALEAYSNAFLYTKSSEAYLDLPLLYEKLGQMHETVLACLHLAVLELEEGKIEEALRTLQWAKINSSELLTFDTLLVSLILERNPDQMQEALSIASSQTDPKEAICIYKQILAVNPREFEAYTALGRLLNNSEEKHYLLSKAADYANREGRLELAMQYREEAMRRVYPNTISQADWANPAPFLEKLPTRPQALLDFLEGPCPIYQGKQAKETHFVVPFTKNITTIVNGTPVTLPRTLKNLDKFDKDSGGTGCRHIWDEILEPPVDRPSDIEFEWVVMTNDVLPESRTQKYETQKNLVEGKGYQVPGFLEAATCILFAKRYLGIRLYGDNPYTFTRCREELQGHHLIVGGFTPVGLKVFAGYGGHDVIGVAGLRKF